MKKLVIGAAAVAAVTIALAATGYAQDTDPPGYMIANYTIKDQAGYDRYMQAAGPLAPRFGGRIIVFNLNATAVEGEPKRSWPSPNSPAWPMRGASTTRPNIAPPGSSVPLRPKVRSSSPKVLYLRSSNR
jgi:hypothetical protein